jgi:ABC-2 type transport system ATP-binding protein
LQGNLILKALQVSKVSKSFGTIKAVDNLSFDVSTGTIFGLLGPNGAGKTTTIRLILDILKPDFGQITILGNQMDERLKDKIGYMPEERGLYQDLTLERALIYLAQLKGVSPSTAQEDLMLYLEHFNLVEYRKKKVKELSRGMQQKAQMIATLLHNPKLIVVDEPFSGLDPLNTQLVKTALLEKRENGSTIILSTHQLNQVEEICERILLMNNGKEVLHGNLENIRYEYSGHSVSVKTGDRIPDIPGILSVEQINSLQRINLEENISPQEFLKSLIKMDIHLESYQIAVPTLDEIFIRVVKGEEIEP